MDFETAILMARGLLQIATFVILASHSGKGCRWKPGVSLLAVVLAGSSAGLGTITVLGASTYLPLPQWLISVYALALFVIAISCRGNVARLVHPYHCRSRA